jgi:hypothetical protein
MKTLSVGSLVCAAVISSALLLTAQITNAPQFLQAATTGIITFSLNQTAQLNVLNANPVAGTTGATATICTAQLEFRDSQNNPLKELLVNNIQPGAAVSLPLTRAEAGSLGTPRFAVRAVVRTSPVSSTASAIPSLFSGCPVVITLEVFNDDTGNTQLVTSDTRNMSPGTLPKVGIAR